jgi:hypothetical protein
MKIHFPLANLKKEMETNKQCLDRQKKSLIFWPAAEEIN